MILWNALAIGKGLENLLEVENANSLGIIYRRYLRLLVEIDITKLILPGFFQECEDGPPIWIQFKYERIGDYYISCGFLGHKKSSCSGPFDPIVSVRYRFSLKVSTFSNFRAHTTPHQPEVLPSTD